MGASDAWQPPGRPWALELLALVFVLGAIFIPFYVQYQNAPEIENLSLVEKATLAEQERYESEWESGLVLMWAIIIVGIYLIHWVLAGSTLDFISVPFVHLISPLVFALILYYRVYFYTKDSPTQISFISGSMLEVLILVVAVSFVTFVIARIQMAGLLRYYHDTKWEIQTQSVVDNTFFGLALSQFRPLVYFPRHCRVSQEGILIEGLAYILPIPFRIVQNIDAVDGSAFLSSGYSLATSTKSLVRIRLSESTQPIYISPENRKEFLEYCDRFVTRVRAGTEPGILRRTTRFPIR